ncbi:MAG: hypothetical protein GX061_01095 [Eubacteriaceae bacterium]|nr:hypothetical protein [Eubacteriaceae bacterium]
MKRITALFALILGAVFILSACAPADAAKLSEQAKEFTVGGDYEKAAEKYRQAIEAGAGKATRRGLIEALEAGKSAENELIEAYEGLYYANGFDNEDYAILAGLYLSSGNYGAARDMYEKYYRLEPSEETLEILKGIVVDAQSDKKQHLQAAQTLLNLLCSDNIEEIINSPADELFSALCPKLSAGYRRYYLKSEGKTLKIEAGYDKSSAAYLNCFLTLADNSVKSLSVYNSQELSFLKTSAGSGGYEGAFEMWCLSISQRNFHHYKGNFTLGRLSGKLECEAAFGLEGDFSGLWEAGNKGLTAYSGSFNENGKTTCAQQTAVTGTGGAVYAYNSANTKFLYLKGAKDGADHIFTSETFGAPPYPLWEETVKQ